MSLASLSAGWNTSYDVPKPSNKREQHNSQQQQLSSSSPSIIKRQSTPAKVAQMPKGRYNYASRMLLAI
jgi:hypothetical protein